MDEGISEKIIAIIAGQCGVDVSEISRDTHLINDLNMDSLDSVELVMKLEDLFEISISDEDAALPRTVGDIINYFEDRSDGDGSAGVPSPLPTSPPPRHLSEKKHHDTP